MNRRLTNKAGVVTLQPPTRVDIVINGRSRKWMEEAIADIRLKQKYPRATGTVADLSTLAGVEMLMASALRFF